MYKVAKLYKSIERLNFRKGNIKASIFIEENEALKEVIKEINNLKNNFSKSLEDEIIRDSVRKIDISILENFFNTLTKMKVRRTTVSKKKSLFKNNVSIVVGADGTERNVRRENVHRAYFRTGYFSDEMSEYIMDEDKWYNDSSNILEETYAKSIDNFTSGKFYSDYSDKIESDAISQTSDSLYLFDEEKLNSSISSLLENYVAKKIRES